MDFDKSTQSRSWTFSLQTLQECRDHAVKFSRPSKDCCSSPKRVRKYASGFHRKREQGLHIKTGPTACCNEPRSGGLPITCDDQELLVSFHVKQIGLLVGPNAVLPGLKRSSTVLATAIIFFRRFFLSNSVVEFKPRNIAAACALLASKAEDNANKIINIRLLERATTAIHTKLQGTSVDGDVLVELGGVSKAEIAIAEKQLMEGLNYEMRCHHPHGPIKALVMDYISFLKKSGVDLNEFDDIEFVLEDTATKLANCSIQFSDLPFLFPPGQIAFATVAMAIKEYFYDRSENVTNIVQLYLRGRFPRKSEADLVQFESRISRAIAMIHSGIRKGRASKSGSYHKITLTFDALETAVKKIAQTRDAGIEKCTVVAPNLFECSKKRNIFEVDYASPCSSFDLDCPKKAAKVTPNPC